MFVDWISGQNEVRDKVPSWLAYPEENNFDTMKIGLECRAGMKLVQWWKLLLDGKRKRAEFGDNCLTNAIGGPLFSLPPDKTAFDVCQDCLEAVYDKVIEHLENKLGTATFEDTDLVIHLAVPGTWDGAVRDRYLKCAQAAGIGSRQKDTINLIDEAEAGILAAMQPKLQGLQPRAFEV
jgi:hypothetical protein